MRRRPLLLGGLALAAPALAFGQGGGGRDPFALGVASGYPRADRVVLWTRLAPDPLAPGGGMAPGPVELVWEMAEDEQFRRIVARGRSRTDERQAHAVHVEVQGLRPDRWYWYRFLAGGVSSPVGRTRTAPAAQAAVAGIRLVTASCQQYEQGYFSAHRHIAAEAPDLVLHLGDYIYEISWGRSHVRKHGGGIPTLLAEFRERHALYRSDRDLQAAHAACPWAMIWDDHEVADDYAGDVSPRMADPQQFATVRAAAYQAWYEHMPVPSIMAPQAHGMRIYDRLGWGDLADIVLLDDRQYRNRHACLGTRSGTRTAGDCPERTVPGRSMLGAAQEAWFEDTLRAARARWTVLAQPTLMAEIPGGTAERPTYWMDGWDGYPAARQRLLEAIARHRVGGPLVLGGDVHSFWITDLHTRFDERGPAIATEIVGSSITSDPPPAARLQRALQRLPYVKFADRDWRGYVLLEIGRDHALAHLRTISDPRDPAATLATLASFAVDRRQPGAQRA